jgi:hypothetical protein
VQDVIKKIKNLKTEGAAGPDGFGPRVLQELQLETAPALAAIFTKSMEEGVVPADWRDANVKRQFSKKAPKARHVFTGRFPLPQSAAESWSR